MPAPTDIHGVKRFCGMMQYLAKFIPNLSITLEPIISLTRKDNPCNWNEECAKAFETVKKQVAEETTLTYFDADKELVLQVDSSQDGIGVTLMQHGKPIEFASRLLTTSESHWAQIEKELLSVTYGLQRFDQYTYGRPVIVENDHKPLEDILKKPLSQAPKDYKHS